MKFDLTNILFHANVERALQVSKSVKTDPFRQFLILLCYSTFNQPIRMNTKIITSTFLLALSLVGGAVFGQKKLASPRDSVSGTVNGAKISINYGSPSVKDRKIWGELVPYGEVWRAGANEATTFSTSKSIMVENQNLPAGKYSLFAIPGETEWTIIFNKTAAQWGAYDYKQKDDALRVKIKPVKSGSKQERLVYRITDKGFVLAWENTEAPVMVK